MTRARPHSRWSAHPNQWRRWHRRGGAPQARVLARCQGEDGKEGGDRGVRWGLPRPAPAGRPLALRRVARQTPRAALAPTPRLHASGMVSTQSAEIVRNAGSAGNRTFIGLSADHIAMCAQTHLNAPGAPCRIALCWQFGAAFAPGAPAEPWSGASRSVRRCRKARRCVRSMPIGPVRAIKLRIAKRFLFLLDT
jgi:hypothetical protein